MSEKLLIPKSIYIFYPMQEGWGRAEELVLEVEFSEDEMFRIAGMQVLSQSIADRLHPEKGSGLDRDFVLSGAIGVPWAMSLQNREYALRILAENAGKLDGYRERFFGRQDVLEKYGFTTDVLGDIQTLRDGMDEFISEEPNNDS